MLQIKENDGETMCAKSREPDEDEDIRSIPKR
jgi:hypothetical protein